MSLRWHRGVAIALVILVGSSLSAAAAAVGGDSLESIKPVIGKPIAVPAQPQAGKPFSVSFKVTQQGTGTPLTRGRMICDPSVAGKQLSHLESFRAGVARLSFVVPASAAHQLLKVKVRIEAGGQSATRVSTFLIRSAASPTLSVADASVAEGNAGTTVLSFPVRLSAKSTQVVSIAYATSDGTAKQPADYAAASGTLSFAAGEIVKTIDVRVVGDTTIEQDETFTVTLSGPTSADIARGVATGTIANDDSGKQITPGEYKGATQEGNYVFFTVNPNRTITKFRVNALPARCSSRGGWLRGPEDLADTVIAIRPNGSFAAEERWSGSLVDGDVEWTSRYVKVTGSFPTSTTAQGTISAVYEFNSGGVHYKCTSRVISWTASLES